MENVEDIYRLTPIQEGMLFHSLSEPGAGVYLEQFSCILNGKLDMQLFQDAWQSIVKRHPIFRTIFLWEDVDEPLQVVRQEASLPWSIEDWRDRNSAERKRDFRNLLSQDRKKKIELSKAPCCRILLIREEEDIWRFLWTFHHILLDGWSSLMVLSEVFAQYDATREGHPEERIDPPPFRAYVAWQQSQDLATAEEFWKAELANSTQPSHLRAYETRKSGAPKTHRTEFNLSAKTTSALRKFARENGLTSNTVIHGAWALLLSRYTDQTEVLFGSTVSGRPPTLPDVEHIIGCCINTLPLKLKVDPNVDLVSWLSNLQKKHVSIRNFEHTSHSNIQKWIGASPGTSLFQSLVVFESSPVELSDLGGRDLAVSNYDFRGQSNYPLALLALPGEQKLQLFLIHETAVLGPDGGERLLGHLEQILQWFISSPNGKLKDAIILSDAESQQIRQWEQPASSNDLAPDSVLTLIQEQFESKGSLPAVIFRDQKLTYDELEQKSHSLACSLIDLGVKSGDRVGLCLKRSPEMIVGILGILKAGGAYVPLDPAYPEKRLCFLLEDSGADLVVTNRELSVDFGPANLVLIEDLTISSNSKCPAVIPSPESLAYIIYTSGSSGQPKGVGITHGSLSFSTLARFEFYKEPVQKFLLLSSMSFDSSVAGIFWTLCSGGTLILPEEDLEQDLDALSLLIDDTQATHTLCLPTLLKLILEFSPPDRLKSLQVAIVAGESCPPSLPHQHYKVLPDCKLYNEYGPTEATIWCTAKLLSTGTFDESVSIGRPISGTEISIRDSQLRKVPIGVSGELCVSGPGLAPGYLSDPDLTAKRFVTDSKNPEKRIYRSGDRACWNSNGSLQLLGRIDQQVKIRGYRIEPEEIESALLSHPGVAEAALVVDQASPSQDSVLVAMKAMDPLTADALLNKIENT